MIAHLAAQHPNVRFIGIDFSVRTAERKHRMANLAFLKGYALDILPPCDTVFMNSTACVFTPAEFASYLTLFKAKDVREVVFNEPTWAGYTFDDGPAHVEGAVWFHNYPRALKAAGYRVESASLDPYRHPKSLRPDIRVALVKGVR